MSLSKTDVAYSYIKKKIITGARPPRADVSEEALQAELKMSRTPIREALLQLQAENFLEVYPRKGIVVAPISLDLLNEVYEVRRIVEPYLFRSACGRLPEKWLVRMKEKFLNAPVPKEDFAKFASYHEDLDWEFCSSVLRSVGNRFLQESMRRAYDHSYRFCALSSRESNPIDRDIQEHVRIIDYMIAGDADSVENAVREHVDHTRRSIFMRVLDSIV